MPRDLVERIKLWLLMAFIAIDVWLFHKTNELEEFFAKRFR